jgi:basic membrane protein A and related proteins
MRAFRFLPLLALPILSACSGPAEGPATTNNDEFRVALLTPGPVSDAGWNALAYEGLQAIREEADATVDNQQATGTQIRDAFRSYAQKGYGLVFGHGYEYNDPAVEVAEDFPNTVFVTSSGGKTAKNVGAFRFNLEQGFYLAGMMAALASETGKVGSVALANIPSIDSTLDAFEAGAKAARPDVTTRRIYFQTEGDVAAARQATEQLADQGFDFVIHQANAAAQGVFDAARNKNIRAIGSNLNQNDNPAGSVAASAVIVARPAFLKLAEEVKNKKFEGRVVLMGMEDGAVEFVINPAFEANLSPELRERLAVTKADISSGRLEVPRATF